MVNLYNTKSLGKEWLPSPLRDARGRFGSTDWTTPDAESPAALIYGQKKRWSRIHERILLAVVLILMLGWWSCAGKVHLFQGGKGLEAHVNWKDFAYVTYATDLQYLCNSVMLLESLSRLDVKAERMLLYDRSFDYDSNAWELLAAARETYGARLQPIELQTVLPTDPGSIPSAWASSFTKLLAFNQTQYKRVLALDSDSTVLQPMDELFLLPSTPVAMPKAYWNKMPEQATVPELCDAVALIEPSKIEAKRIEEAIASKGEEEYDMEIMNRLYGSGALVIPHRGYALLTGEFRVGDHSAYLGGSTETWEAEEVLKEAKFVHFSDYPLPKPWIPVEAELVEDFRPMCRFVGGDLKMECKDREVWDWLYWDFRERRRDVCGSDFEVQTWEASAASNQAAQVQEIQEAGGLESDAVVVEAITAVA